MPARLLAPIAVLAVTACAAPTLRLQPRYARLEVTGTAGAVSGGVGGSADLEQAGLEEEDTPAGRLDLDFGSPHLIGLAQAPRFEGSGTLDVAIDDGTNSIPGGAAVDSEMELGTYSLALVFDLIPGDMFELAVGLGAAYLDLAFRFEEQGTGTVVDSELDAPIPLLVAAAAFELGPFELSLVVGGMDYTYEEDSLTMLDGDLSARCAFLGGEKRLRVALVAGYRLTDLELVYDDGSAEIDTDLRVEGPYVGLELSL